MSRTFIARGVLSFATATLLLLPLRVPAASQSEDTASLRRQVEELRRTLQSVQQRLDAIDARLGGLPAPETGVTRDKGAVSTTAPQAPPAAATGSPAKGATLTPEIVEKWKTLHAGMSEKQVRSLLGEPTRTFELSGQPVWYYYYMGVGGGSVMFTDKNGQVLSWQRPPFHSWW